MTDRMYEMFKAARQDGPTPEARAAMWVGIQTASIASTVAGASSGGATGGGTLAAAKAALVSTKLVLGLVLGAALTVGAATTLVVVDVARHPSAAVQAEPVAPRTLARAEVALAASQSPNGNPSVIVGHVAPVETVIELGAGKNGEVPATRVGTTTLSEHDRLLRESRTVSEARGALRRGEPEAALRIVRQAQAQPGARMIPEEMKVEAAALRAMGDDVGAQHVDADRAARFPDSLSQ